MVKKFKGCKIDGDETIYKSGNEFKMQNDRTDTITYTGSVDEVNKYAGQSFSGGSFGMASSAGVILDRAKLVGNEKRGLAMEYVEKKVQSGAVSPFKMETKLQNVGTMEAFNDSYNSILQNDINMIKDTTTLASKGYEAIGSLDGKGTFLTTSVTRANGMNMSTGEYYGNFTLTKGTENNATTKYKLIAVCGYCS